MNDKRSVQLQFGSGSQGNDFLVSALSLRDPNGSARAMGDLLERFKEELPWDLLAS